MNSKEIKTALVTTGHPPFDDRIFWKFARTLSPGGFDITVISTTEELFSTVDSIRFSCFAGVNYTKRKKIKEIVKRLEEFHPEIIICSEPLAVIASNKYRKVTNPAARIIYDITEYYPQPGKGYIKYLYLNWLIMTGLNLLAVKISDQLIIGEEFKAKFYKRIAPGKKTDIIGYYSPLDIFSYSPPLKNPDTFTIGYTGLISVDRGINRFLEIFRILRTQHKNFLIKAIIIGKFKDEAIKEKVLNVLQNYPPESYEISDWTDYRNYAEAVKKIDLCIDLRDRNRLFDRSLPIKLFDMIAAGRRTIITNLKSLRQVKDIDRAAFVTEPNDYKKITDKINFCLSDKDLFIKDSLNIRELAETKYNWELLGKKLIKIVNELTDETGTLLN